MANRKTTKVASTELSYTAFDAKNRLGELLDRVYRGQEITITRHGIEIARVIPIERGRTLQIRPAMKRVKTLRDEIRASGKSLSVKDILGYREEGRR